ncbi:MAG: M24 family metallopeptidase, partial [Candidatus Roizmanbacteria bacterium]|nr:M24 family metallopeptidase [Candidatus Roizmanbacteria bacterium]
IGLAIHELPHISPQSTEVLQPNMVFTIEPGLYFSRSFGLRIEDTVLLTNKGAVVLTKFPKRLSSVI